MELLSYLSSSFDFYAQINRQNAQFPYILCIFFVLYVLKDITFHFFGKCYMTQIFLFILLCVTQPSRFRQIFAQKQGLFFQKNR